MPDSTPARSTAFSRYDALGLAELVRRRETRPEELLAWAIENLEGVNPQLNCIAHTHYDEARAQIASGLAPGAFRGVPFILKDLGIELAGTVTSCGSIAFKDYRPSADSELAARYKRAGLVIFAKSTTPELGLAYTTESKAFGLTRNPWDPERSAGGSSGGAAGAVAAGIVPMAHASDGGGSIRVPTLGLSPADLAAYRREVSTYSPFTAIANMTGQPSMSVPLFWTSAGLPIGALFTGRYGEESVLLRLAAQLEAAQPWARSRAPGFGS